MTLLFTVDTISTLLLALVVVAFLTLLERRALAAIHLRSGPKRPAQPLADALKLLSKELILPSSSHPTSFFLSPLLAFFLAYLPWFILPLGPGLFVWDIHLGLPALMAVSSLSVFPILISGWASQSEYPILGALRASATMLSYELVLGLVLLSSLSLGGSLSWSSLQPLQTDIWLALPCLPGLILTTISSFAETARPPFDLTEGESELVGGFHTEFSAIHFSLFALAEYSHLCTASILILLCFFGGSSPTKLILALLFAILVRSAAPRYRIDSLMYLNWKHLLLVSLAWATASWTYASFV